MSEEFFNEYKDGDIVWVKLGPSWWPGEVTDLSKIPPDEIEFKKPPLAVVKFFEEDTYEYVRNWSNIYPYNCEKKAEFIKKGMAAFRSKAPHMEKFPKDVTTAEVKKGGNPNILSDPACCPEKKRNYVAEVFGTPNLKKGPKDHNKKSRSSTKNNPKDAAHITHRRFLGLDDYKAYICIQYPEKDRIPGDSEDEEVIHINTEAEQEYNCHSCPYTTKRLEVMILHTKSHIQGVYVSSPRRKRPIAARPRKKEYIKKRITTYSDDSSSEDIPEPPKEKKRKTKVAITPKKTSKKVIEEVKKPKTTDIRTDLLAEWEDTDDEFDNSIFDDAPRFSDTFDTTGVSKMDETNDFSNKESDIEIKETDNDNKDVSDIESEPSVSQKESNKMDKDTPKPQMDKETPESQTDKETSEPQTDKETSEPQTDKETSEPQMDKKVPKPQMDKELSKVQMDKETQEAIKSCFDFDEDDEEDVLINTTVEVGRKIPRVIPPTEKRKSEILEDIIDLEEGINKEEILKVSQSLNEKIPSKETEELENAFNDLMDTTSVPQLPEIENSLKPTQNFHVVTTIKFPDKPDESPKKDREKTSTEIPINPKKRFVKSFEDFENQLQQEENRKKEEENLKKKGDSSAESFQVTDISIEENEDTNQVFQQAKSSFFQYRRSSLSPEKNILKIPKKDASSSKAENIKEDKILPQTNDTSGSSDEEATVIDFNKLQTSIMSKIIEEAKIPDESKNRILAKMKNKRSTPSQNLESEKITLPERRYPSRNRSEQDKNESTEEKSSVENKSEEPELEDESLTKQEKTVPKGRKCSAKERKEEKTSSSSISSLTDVNEECLQPKRRSYLKEKIEKTRASLEYTSNDKNQNDPPKPSCLEDAIEEAPPVRRFLRSTSQEDTDIDKPSDINEQVQENILQNEEKVSKVPFKKSRWSRSLSYPKQDRDLFKIEQTQNISLPVKIDKSLVFDISRKEDLSDDIKTVNSFLENESFNKEKEIVKGNDFPEEIHQKEIISNETPAVEEPAVKDLTESLEAITETIESIAESVESITESVEALTEITAEKYAKEEKGELFSNEVVSESLQNNTAETIRMEFTETDEDEDKLNFVQEGESQVNGIKTSDTISEVSEEFKQVTNDIPCEDTDSTDLKIEETRNIDELSVPSLVENNEFSPAVQLLPEDVVCDAVTKPNKRKKGRRRSSRFTARKKRKHSRDSKEPKANEDIEEECVEFETMEKSTEPLVDKEMKDVDNEIKDVGKEINEIDSIQEDTTEKSEVTEVPSVTDNELKDSNTELNAETIEEKLYDNNITDVESVEEETIFEVTIEQDSSKSHIDTDTEIGETEETNEKHIEAEERQEPLVPKKVLAQEHVSCEVPIYAEEEELAHEHVHSEVPIPDEEEPALIQEHLKSMEEELAQEHIHSEVAISTEKEATVTKEDCKTEQEELAQEHVHSEVPISEEDKIELTQESVETQKEQVTISMEEEATITQDELIREEIPSGVQFSNEELDITRDHLETKESFYKERFLTEPSEQSITEENAVEKEQVEMNASIESVAPKQQQVADENVSIEHVFEAEVEAEKEVVSPEPMAIEAKESVVIEELLSSEEHIIKETNTIEEEEEEEEAKKVMKESSSEEQKIKEHLVEEHVTQEDILSDPSISEENERKATPQDLTEMDITNKSEEQYTASKHQKLLESLFTFSENKDKNKQETGLELDGVGEQTNKNNFDINIESRKPLSFNDKMDEEDEKLTDLVSDIVQKLCEEQSEKTRDLDIENEQYTPEKNGQYTTEKTPKIDESSQTSVSSTKSKSDNKENLEKLDEKVKDDDDEDSSNSKEVEILCASNSNDPFKFCIQTNLSNLSRSEEISAIALATLSELKTDMESSDSNSNISAPKGDLNFPEKLSETEMVAIEGNLTVMSEKDLADAQVEITTDKVISSKKPVMLSNFSMDFSDSASDSGSLNEAPNECIKYTDFDSKGTEFTSRAMTKELKPRTTMKKVNAYDQCELLNILEGNAEMEKKVLEFQTPICKSFAGDIMDFEECIPSQIVCTKQFQKNIDEELKKKDKCSSVMSTTSKLLERLTDAKNLENKIDVPSDNSPVKNVKNQKTKSKPIILSEQIIKPAITESKKILPPPPPPAAAAASSNTVNDIEDVEAFVIHKDLKKNNVEVEEPKLVSPVKAVRRTRNKPAGKAKILQQTIITPAGEIIQPAAVSSPKKKPVPPVTTATLTRITQSVITNSTPISSTKLIANVAVDSTSQDDNIFDIFNMPIVLSDQILTPESIENMSIVIDSETAANKSAQTLLASKVAASKVMTKVISSTTPTLIPTKVSNITPKQKPRILQTVGTKPSTLASAILPQKPGKYIIVSQGTPGIAQQKFLQKKTIMKRGSLPSASIGTKIGNSQEITGNKIMVVTNQQGQQQRLLLTPAQQKVLGYQSTSGPKLAKTVVKPNLLQKSLAPASKPEAGSSKAISLLGPKIVATTSSQILSGTSTFKPLKTPIKGRATPNQKATTTATTSSKTAKTILITNKHGQTIKKIATTEDDIDKQVAEQLEAIKASSGMQFGTQSKTEIATNRSIPKAPNRRPYSKKQEPKPKLTPTLARTDSTNPPPLISTSKKPIAGLPEPKKLTQEEPKPQPERPLNQLVIQDALGNQTTITEGQILALPSETVDGQPQSYMLVTLDQSGNLTPLNNEALMSLDPNLGLGGDLSNMVLQIDQGSLGSSMDQPMPLAQPATVKLTNPGEELQAGTSKIDIPRATAPLSLPVANDLPSLEPKLHQTIMPAPAEASVNIESIVSNSNGEQGQQLIVTGDPIATQKFLESLTEGTTDLANIIANAEGKSILIQADGQQILINTNTDSQLLQNVGESTEGGGNPIFATQPSKNTDILAAALADTDVFTTQPKISQLSPNNALYPMNVGNVLETSLTLSSPIMTPLEVPSTNSKKIPDDEADILTQIPKNVDLPITITDPNISQTVANQQVATLIANELQTNLELVGLGISETAISTVATGLTSPGYSYSLPTLDENDISHKPFNSSMPLLNDDVDETPSSNKSQEDKDEDKNEDNLNNSERFLEEESRFTLGGGMCSSLSEPPPEMFDIPDVNSYEEKNGNNIPLSLRSTPNSKDDDTTDVSMQAESSSEGSCEIPLQPMIVAKSVDLSESSEI